MSRIRTIKPELFRHEELFEAESHTGLPLRLAFIGLLTVADCEGRFVWKPRTIKLDVLPYDDVDFSAILAELESAGFIRRYQVSGKLYGLIPNFKKHQQIPTREQERGSSLPEPPSKEARPEHEPVHAQARPEHDPVHAQACTEQGLEFREGNRKGKGKGKEGSIAASRRAPALKTPFPADLTITPELRAWANEHGYQNLERHLDTFRDKAIANGYQYADWNAALRNAIRDDWAGLRTPKAKTQRPADSIPPVQSPFRNPRADEFDAILRGGQAHNGQLIEGELADAIH